MVAKKGPRSVRSVKSLKAKSLTAKQAKAVKGGIIIVNSRLSNPPEPVSPGLVNPPEPDFGINR